jgi:SUKH-4 immunity protein
MKGFSFVLCSIESDSVFRSSPSPFLGENTQLFKSYEGHDLSGYRVIVDESANLGHAWYCEDQISGAIYRVYPDAENLVEFVNSGQLEFTLSLTAAAQWSAQHDSNVIRFQPSVIEDLAGLLLMVDPKAFKSQQCFWPSILNHLRVCVHDCDEGVQFCFKVE